MRRLDALRHDPRTLVVFESPRRVQILLRDALVALGDRRIAIARELTKLHEEVMRGRIVGGAVAHRRRRAQGRGRRRDRRRAHARDPRLSRRAPTRRRSSSTRACASATPPTPSPSDTTSRPTTCTASCSSAAESRARRACTRLRAWTSASPGRWPAGYAFDEPCAGAGRADARRRGRPGQQGPAAAVHGEPPRARRRRHRHRQDQDAADPGGPAFGRGRAGVHRRRERRPHRDLPAGRCRRSSGGRAVRAAGLDVRTQGPSRRAAVAERRPRGAGPRHDPLVRAAAAGQGARSQQDADLGALAGLQVLRRRELPVARSGRPADDA